MSETIQAFSDIDTEVELYPPVLTTSGYDYPNKIKTPFWDTEESEEDEEDGDTEVELYPPVLTTSGYDYPNKIKNPILGHRRK